MSLENYDAKPRRLLRRRYSGNGPSSVRSRLNLLVHPKEALIVFLNEKGKVDLPHMARLLSRPVDEFLPRTDRSAFSQSSSPGVGTEDHYLSGTCAKNLRLREAASIIEPRFKENVEG